MTEQEEKTITMPVSKMHYSMLTQLLRNPLIFKLKYVFGVYDGKVGVSGMIGKAAHEALKYYYGGNPDMPVTADRVVAREEAIALGMKYLTEYSDIYIKFGKSNREKMLAGYTKAMQHYFAEEPDYNEIVMVEEKMEAEIETVDGDAMPLPCVGVPDIVHRRKDGQVEIIDTKFVKSFTKYENDDGEPHEDYIKVVQAMFLWHLLRKSKGLTADRVLFREVKTTENTGANAGTPQIRDYVIPCNHEPYRIIFYNLFKDVVKFLSNPDAVYLPNLSDPFDGEQAGMLYAQGLLTADMSDAEVMHKVKDLAIVSKKFLGSRLDRIENKNLLPEEKIKIRLAEFGIPVEPVDSIIGSSITLHRFKVSAGVRMSTIQKHKADIALAIESKGEIRIVAPIPGTAYVGVEVPNETRTSVKMTKQHLMPGTLSVPVGVDIHGEVVWKSFGDDMPHLLIAGSPGSGKSILLNIIITALSKQLDSNNLNMILIDPKRVELLAFEKLKHLKGGGIIHSYEEAVIALKAAMGEMEDRYIFLKKNRCRDIAEYNRKHEDKKIPSIVIVVDEFADLMLQGKLEEKKNKKKKSIGSAAQRETAIQMARRMAKMGLVYEPDDIKDENPTVEEMIVRIAQLGRAASIHLIIATQRPSVDVITGLIKAQFTTRIALTTASAVDSKVILGEDGAERLNGRGDMIIMTPSMPKTRLQGLMIDIK